MVFEDQSGIRRKTASIVAGVILAGGVGLLAILVASLFLSPRLPGFAGPSNQNNEEVVTAASDDTGWTDTSRAVRPDHPVIPSLTKPFLRTAFVDVDDPNSIADLKRHMRDLDVVFPNWFSFATAAGQIQQNPHASRMDSLPRGDTLVLPMLSNTDPTGAWHPKELAAFLHDETNNDCFIQELKAKVVAVHADGINLDLELLSSDDTEDYLDWLNRLVQSFHVDHLLVTVDVPLNDEAFDYEYIGEIADAVVVMAYDQHWDASAPGPVADMDWFQDGLAEVAQKIPLAKLIVGLGAYGYDWDLTSKQPAESLGFAETMQRAGKFQADIESHAPPLNPAFGYDDVQNHHHQVWFLDAVTAWNQYLAAQQVGVRGVSFWRLGLEEPGLWEYLTPAVSQPFFKERLKVAQSQPLIYFRGDGEVLTVSSTPRDGVREMTFDERMVDYWEYKTLPEYYSVNRLGRSGDRRIALTFDDGPDHVWTPQILQLLKEYNVPATFFVIGSQAQQEPDLLRRELAEGHLLGNHTFLHPDLQKISAARQRLELNATQRTIESITGHATLLFRSPYDVDTAPNEPRELQPLRAATQQGYLVVGANIDPQDYMRPGGDTISRSVLAGLQSEGASIVLFHDGGVDRRDTVAALQILLPRLQREGYQFVTIDQLLGVTRAELMPGIGLFEHCAVFGMTTVIWARTHGWPLLVYLFFVTTTVSLLRIAFLTVIVLRHYRTRAAAAAEFTPPVLVLVPAYNEAQVIHRTLHALLRSDYPDFSILVVDDGSTDETARIVTDHTPAHPQVRLLSTPNNGKAAALNLGFRAAREDYIVTIDADTIVMQDTIRHLIAPFADPVVDAVCGNVQVGNVRNVLTAFQNLEYVTTQNYDRRAFDSLNCISVVPGATGAWKRQAVLRIGGYSDSTLTEDADLTLTLLEEGGRVVYAPLAKSITETPETARALFKQRFRWSFGTYQCLWKHRRSFFQGTLGWLALPNMLCFQVVFPLLSPIGDLVLVLSLFRNDFRAVALGYSLFLVMDLCASLIAFKLDQKKLRGMWAVLVQRFYYRQFMYIVAFRSVVTAIRGRRQRWYKMERRAMPHHHPVSASLRLG